MFRVAWKVPGGVMTEGGTWAHGWVNVSIPKNTSWHEGEMPEETTMDDLDAIKGSPWPPLVF